MSDHGSERLSQIATQWSLLMQAHWDEGDDRHRAFAELLPRYCRAIERYLRKLVGEAAHDLSQEFAVRFLRGEFRHADPERGRFRDYVKTAIIHQALAYRKKLASRVSFGPPPDDLAQMMNTADDNAFRDLWRRDLMNRAWSALEQESKEKADLHYAALYDKSEHPEATSAQIAERLSTLSGREVTAVNVRQLIHRARTKFAEYLRSEVAATLPGDDATSIDEELAELGLLKYFQ